VQAFDDDGARLPGSRRLALRERAERSGVVVDAKLYAEVAAIAQHARKA
jgi:(2R)-3-sulfolactate dehydrogenase (NADP+)